MFSLLGMNSVIIHKLRTRNVGEIGVAETQGQDQDQRAKTTDGQIFAILLLVTFALLILTTPAYVLFVYVIYVDFFASPKLFAGTIFFIMWPTNYRLQIMELISFSMPCQVGNLEQI